MISPELAMIQGLQLLANPPEWMAQQSAIQAGEKTWDDYSFEQRTVKGWLWPHLLRLEPRLIGRWDWWMDAMINEALPDTPIPHIDFVHSHEPQAVAGLKMLESCLNHHSVYSSGATLPDFLAWLLWGFGSGDERPRVGPSANEHWYKTFNMGLILAHPSDYLGVLISDAKSGRTYWNNPHAFFPTPHNVVECMVQMQMHGMKDRTASVLDPCMGTGRMLMHASNFSVNLHGCDIDRTVIMAAKLNGFFYVPWLVRSADWLPAPAQDEAPVTSAEIIPLPIKPDIIVDKKGQMKLFG